MLDDTSLQDNSPIGASAEGPATLGQPQEPAPGAGSVQPGRMSNRKINKTAGLLLTLAPPGAGGQALGVLKAVDWSGDFDTEEGLLQGVVGGLAALREVARHAGPAGEELAYALGVGGITDTESLDARNLLKKALYFAEAKGLRNVIPLLRRAQAVAVNQPELLKRVEERAVGKVRAALSVGNLEDTVEPGSGTTPQTSVKEPTVVVQQTQTPKSNHAEVEQTTVSSSAPDDEILQTQLQDDDELDVALETPTIEQSTESITESEVTPPTTDTLVNNVEQPTPSQASPVALAQDRRTSVLVKQVIKEVPEAAPFIGNPLSVVAALRGKTLAGRKLTGKERLVQGAVGAAGLALEFIPGVGEVSEGVLTAVRTGKLTEQGLLAGKSVSLFNKAAKGVATRSASGSRLFAKTAQFLEKNPVLTKQTEVFVDTHISGLLASNHPRRRLASSYQTARSSFKVTSKIDGISQAGGNQQESNQQVIQQAREQRGPVLFKQLVHSGLAAMGAKAGAVSMAASAAGSLPSVRDSKNPYIHAFMGAVAASSNLQHVSNDAQQPTSGQDLLMNGRTVEALSNAGSFLSERGFAPAARIANRTAAFLQNQPQVLQAAEQGFNQYIQPRLGNLSPEWQNLLSSFTKGQGGAKNLGIGLNGLAGAKAASRAFLNKMGRLPDMSNDKDRQILNQLHSGQHTPGNQDVDTAIPHTQGNEAIGPDMSMEAAVPPPVQPMQQGEQESVANAPTDAQEQDPEQDNGKDNAAANHFRNVAKYARLGAQVANKLGLPGGGLASNVLRDASKFARDASKDPNLNEDERHRAANAAGNKLAKHLNTNRGIAKPRSAALGGAFAGALQGQDALGVANTAANWWILATAFGAIAFTWIGTLVAFPYIHVHNFLAKRHVKVWIFEFQPFSFSQRITFWLLNLLCIVVLLVLIVLLILVYCNVPGLGVTSSYCTNFHITGLVFSGL